LSTLEVCKESIVDDIDLVHVNASQQVIAACANVSGLKHKIPRQFPLNAECILSDHRYLQIRIDRTHVSKETLSRTAILKEGPVRSRENRGWDLESASCAEVQLRIAGWADGI
jgi:hypothetical protein